MLGDLRGEMSGSTSDIQYPLAGLWGEQFHDRRSEFPDERMLLVIEFGVPLGFAHELVPLA